ncbi:MAG: LysR family transcriptional regulator [Elusimicrobia bacterium]|nr:LysR family transcriptional regulator [Elusimicrobiota bacterium]
MHDLDSLQAFYRVGRAGGVGAAAREMKVTQPAISQRLRRLERAFGRKLYGMAGRRLVLTEEGRRLFAACRQAFDVLEAAGSAFTGRQETPLIGTVRIATLSELSKVFLLPQVRLFRLAHPGVAFDILYQQPYEIVSMISRHEVDFGITNEAYRRPQIELSRAFMESVVCVGPGPARRLSWDDVERLNWMAYGVDDPLWLEFQSLAAKRGARLPGLSLRVSDVESVLTLAAEGVGYALAPAHAVGLRKLRGLTLHTLPFSTIRKQIYFCRLKTVPLGRAGAAFLDHLKAACASFT